MLEQKSDYEYIWTGSIPNGSITIGQDNGKVFGQVIKGQEIYGIQHLSRGYGTLIKYNTELLRQRSCAVDELDNQKQAKHRDENAIGNNSDLEFSASTTNAVIRVLVLFTQAAEDTGMDMVSLANSVRADWLTAQANSNVYPTLQIAGVVELDFDENGPNNNRIIEQDLVALETDLTAQQLRDQHEADIVILITDGDYPGVAGIAYRGLNEALAYGIVQAGNATGTSTFVHEVGHIFGARHEIEDDPTPGENHGYSWDARGGGWPVRARIERGSIMHTQELGVFRVLHWSNPFIQNGGNPTGELGTAWVANMLNQNGTIVCDFRINPPSVAIYGPGTAEGGDVISFTSGVSQGNSPYTYKWEADIGGGFFTAGRSTSLNVTMPTNSDLEVRLTVTDADGRVNTDTHFVMNTYYGGGCTICPDLFGYDVNVSKIDHDKPLAFPVPAGEVLNVILPENDILYLQYQIIDPSGKVIMDKRITDDEREALFLEVNLRAIESSSYIFRLKGDSKVDNLRFIKQ